MLYIDEIEEMAAEDGKIIVIPGRIFDELKVLPESLEKAAKMLYSALLLSDEAVLPFDFKGTDKMAVLRIADACCIYVRDEDGDINGEEE